MAPFRRRFLKVFAFLTVLGFGSILADMHADECQPKQASACCVTCCPAHHLAPSPVAVTIPLLPQPVSSLVPVIVSVSSDFIASIFHPPRRVS